MLLTLVTAVMMVYVNRQFNLLHTLSVYFSSLFMVMAAGCAWFISDYDLQLLLPIIILGGMTMLYRCYDTEGFTQPIFMLFFLISGAGYLNSAFLLYLPVFAIGMRQVKCSKGLKIWLAAIIGILTPWWLLWAFLGVNPLTQLMAYFQATAQAWNVVILPEYKLLVPWVFTMVLVLLLWLVNVIKILAYNTHDRAVNGVLSLMTVATWIYCVVDFINLTFYIPLLCCLTAFQMGHFFRLFLNKRAYILATVVLGCYTGFYFL